MNDMVKLVLLFVLFWASISFVMWWGLFRIKRKPDEQPVKQDKKGLAWDNCLLRSRVAELEEQVRTLEKETNNVE